MTAARRGGGGMIIIGGGGHARALIDILLSQNRDIIGYTERYPEHDIGLPGISRVGGDDDIFDYPPGEILLVNGVGSVSAELLMIRWNIYMRFTERGYNFPAIISDRAIVSKLAEPRGGVQIMPGAAVQTRASIGENSIINTGAIVEHDCKVGKNTHIASGAVLCGGVSVGDCAHVGAGATVIQGVSVGEHSLVAAGAVVIKNVPPRTTVMGVPARGVAPGPG